MQTYEAGKLVGIDSNKPQAYEYFLPSYINHEYQFDNKKLQIYLQEATRYIGELNAYGNLIPDVEFFIKMHVVSEAVSSTKIEGTKTSMDEALLAKNEIEPEKRDDWQEVMNYIAAMRFAIERLEHLPVSVRLIKETHKILLSGVRGEHKSPGEIRTSQNWIGGASINSAHFVPPQQQHLPELLSDWEMFWHNDGLGLPALIKVAICHYQFETIHPFLDGNGRIGRLLILLQLIEKGFLDSPVLYISDFFETHRQAYYDSLSLVRRENNIEQWILFFLEAVLETAKKAKQSFEKIIKLRSMFETKVAKLGRKSESGLLLLNFLWSNPIVKIKDVEEELGIGYTTANRLVKDFVELGILIEKTGFSRNRLFALEDYIRLFR